MQRSFLGLFNWIIVVLLQGKELISLNNNDTCKNMRKNTRVKELNKFALPLIVQSIAGQILVLGDHALIGRISVEAYSVTGIISNILYTIAGVAGCITLVLNIRAGKAMGENNEQLYKDEFSTSLLLSLYLGVIFAVLLNISSNMVLTDLWGYSGAMFDIGLDYIRIMSPYLLLQLLLFAFATKLKVLQKTKWIMIGSTISNVVDLLVDYVLIFGKFGFPQMGVNAVSISTIFSMCLNLGIYIWVCRKEIGVKLQRIGIYHHLMIKQIKQSIPFMGQELLDGSIFAFVISTMVARIGVIETAGYTISKQLLNLIEMPMYMYASATLTLVSMSYGAKNRTEISEYTKLAIRLSYFFVIVVASIFIIFKEQLPRIITDDMAAQNYASSVFVYIVVAYSCNGLSTILRNALQALSESKFVLYSTAIVNTIVMVLLLLIVELLGLQLIGVLACLFLNYAIISIIYWVKFDRKMKSF